MTYSYSTRIDGRIDTRSGEAYCWRCAGSPEDWNVDTTTDGMTYRSLPIVALSCSTCGNAVGIVEVWENT